jgi:L-ascorbate metabolism protein UlaG (beta-lactamase superfamily)
VIHVDPVGRYADYGKLHKADIILITHEHSDHLDAKAVSQIEKKGTSLILNQAARDQLGKGQALGNGDSLTVLGVRIQAVPAYNTTPGRDKFHPRGRGNGYVLQLGNKRVYVAGDTEDIPEMAELGDIDIAFLPVNQPYTMTSQQATDAAKMIKPKVLYPYHYGETDLSGLAKLLKDVPGVELRVRKMK